MTLKPDRAEAERFLAALDPDAKSWTFQTFDDNRERRDQNKKTKEVDPFAKVLHGTLAEHWNELARRNAQGVGVFVTVNMTNGRGRLAEDIERVRALFADLDGSPLDPVIAAGAMQPHIVAESSPGRWHAYWRVDKLPLDGFTPLQKAIAARYNGDKVHDLPRVMRLPGFIHGKGEPFLSRIERINIIKANGHGGVSEAYRPARWSRLFSLRSTILRLRQGSASAGRRRVGEISTSVRSRWRTCRDGCRRFSRPRCGQSMVAIAWHRPTLAVGSRRTWGSTRAGSSISGSLIWGTSGRAGARRSSWSSSFSRSRRRRPQSGWKRLLMAAAMGKTVTRRCRRRRRNPSRQRSRRAISKSRSRGSRG